MNCKFDLSTEYDKSVVDLGILKSPRGLYDKLLISVACISNTCGQAREYLNQNSSEGWRFGK